MTLNPYEPPPLDDENYTVSKSKTQRYNMISTVMAITGMVPYVGCVLAGHVCMAGHWHHPPYPWWSYAIDAAWILCFGVAFIFAVADPSRRLFIPFVALLGFLTVSRLTGFLSMIMLPVEFFASMTLILFAVARIAPPDGSEHLSAVKEGENEE